MIDSPLLERGRRVCRHTSVALLAVLCAVSLAACSLGSQDSGTPPEGVRRDLPVPGDDRFTSSPDADPASGGPAESARPLGAPPVSTPASHAAVTAVTATGEYHRSSCSLLTGAGATRSFASAFEAVDAGLFPCATCKPGP